MTSQNVEKIVNAIDRLTEVVKQSNKSDMTKLLEMKFKILEMQSDHYNWSCHVPQETKDQLEAMLVTIDKQLKENV